MQIVINRVNRSDNQSLCWPVGGAGGGRCSGGVASAGEGRKGRWGAPPEADAGENQGTLGESWERL